MIKTQFDEIAKISGMPDEAAIAACLADEAHLNTLQTSANRASAAGISGIPSVIFNGEVMEGDYDAAAIKRWVEQK